MYDVCVYLFGLGMYGARPGVSSSSAAKDGDLNSHWCMYVCMNECIYANENVRKHYYHFSLKPMRYCMGKAHKSRLNHGGATQDTWAEYRNVCMHIFMYNCYWKGMYTALNIAFQWMHLCMYAYLNGWGSIRVLYVCMYVCMYVCDTDQWCRSQLQTPRIRFLWIARSGVPAFHQLWYIHTYIHTWMIAIDI
jgi:hypothetical protein